MHVEQRRGGLLESRHRVSAAAITIPRDSEPIVRFETGSEHRSFWRSAAKPFQLLAVLEALEASGHSENTPYTPRSLSDEELAIGASSHSGGAEHLVLVRRLLARAGLSESQLLCGADWPLDPTALAQLHRTGAAASALHNDCSGKHTMMLWACLAHGWSTTDYLHPDHPLQQRVAATVTRFTGAEHPTAIDGCGVPTFWMSIHEMALAWAHLAAAMADPDTDPLLGRIGHAMAEHPELTSGTGRLDLAVARRARGPFVGKIGALGVFCVAWPAGRTGMAIKVHSGNEDALAVAIDALVPTCCPDALTPNASWPWHGVSNAAGTLVGSRRLTGLDLPPSSKP